MPIGAQGFRRLRAATYFAHGGKVGKTPPGTAPDEHFVLIVALPRTPIYGSHPLKCAEHFRRAKSGVLGYYPVRPHWGPEWGENWDWCDSMPAPELAEPTSLVRNMGYLIRPLRGHLPLKGKAGGCHFKAFPFRGRWLAEGQTDEAGGQRPPAGRRGRRPLRQNRKIPPSRRGGCPHPPASEDSSHS